MPEQVKVDFGTLKTNVLIGAVLSKSGVQYKQPNKEYLRADCPLASGGQPRPCKSQSGARNCKTNWPKLLKTR
jgi:hypothetical protein